MIRCTQWGSFRMSVHELGWAWGEGSGQNSGDMRWIYSDTDGIWFVMMVRYLDIVHIMVT